MSHYTEMLTEHQAQIILHIIGKSITRRADAINRGRS